MESLQLGFELFIIRSLHKSSPWLTLSRAAWLGHTGTAMPLFELTPSKSAISEKVSSPHTCRTITSR